MIDNIIGFLWGFICAIICVDIWSDAVNWYWYIYLPLIIFIAIVTLVGKLYSFITDYKAMAETGWSCSKKIYMWATNKYKKKLINENLTTN